MPASNLTDREMADRWRLIVAWDAGLLCWCRVKTAQWLRDLSAWVQP